MVPARRTTQAGQAGSESAAGGVTCVPRDSSPAARKSEANSTPAVTDCGKREHLLGGRKLPGQQREANSPVAQWWSERLLTARLQVRALPGEPFENQRDSPRDAKLRGLSCSYRALPVYAVSCSLPFFNRHQNRHLWSDNLGEWYKLKHVRHKGTRGEDARGDRLRAPGQTSTGQGRFGALVFTGQRKRLRSAAGGDPRKNRRGSQGVLGSPGTYIPKIFHNLSAISRPGH